LKLNTNQSTWHVIVYYMFLVRGLG
jgi:hypothetical protein